MERSSFDDEVSSGDGTHYLLKHEYQEIGKPLRKKWVNTLCICNCIALVLNMALLLTVLVYLRLQSGHDVRLVTDDFTRGAVELETRIFDDIIGPHGSVFQGPPTPELDKAWMDLMEGYTTRIPAPGWNTASSPNRTLVQLTDGSGDMLAVPAFLHQIHCLKTIREYLFGEHYPKTWARNKPKEGEVIGPHIDHCLDTLRQSVMCHGDMTLLMYEWWEDNPIPQTVVHSPHVCANWERISTWAKDHAVAPWGDILRNPYTGEVPYPLD